MISTSASIPAFTDCVVAQPRAISTIVDTPHTLETRYSTPCKVLCWYCSYPFSDRPFAYPEPFQYFPRTRKIMPRGFYCSPNCVLAQIVYLNSGWRQNQQLEWFHQMMRDVYGMKNSHTLRPSPPQRMLKNKGGTITKDQLRILHNVLPGFFLEERPFLTTINVIKEMVRDLEKGKEKQRQMEFAKQLMETQQKQKKKPVSSRIASASIYLPPPPPRLTGKKRKCENEDEQRTQMQQQHVQLPPFKVPNTLVLDEGEIDLGPLEYCSRDRRPLVEQVLGLSKVGDRDWWNFNQTENKFPERKQEIVDSIAEEMDQEDQITSKLSVRTCERKLPQLPDDGQEREHEEEELEGCEGDEREPEDMADEEGIIIVDDEDEDLFS